MKFLHLLVSEAQFEIVYQEHYDVMKSVKCFTLADEAVSSYFTS